MRSVFPCSVVLPECGCSNNPLVENLSAEAPDLPTFTGINFAYYPPVLGGPPTIPCMGIATSPVSQEAADLAAEVAGFQCGFAPLPGSGTGTGGGGQSFGGPGINLPSQPSPPPQFVKGPVHGTPVYNAYQLGTAKCPDGSVFYYPVAAGLFADYSLARANAKALSYGNNQAAKLKTCPAPPPPPPPFEWGNLTWGPGSGALNIYTAGTASGSGLSFQAKLSATALPDYQPRSGSWGPTCNPFGCNLPTPSTTYTGPATTAYVTITLNDKVPATSIGAKVATFDFHVTQDGGPIFDLTSNRSGTYAIPINAGTNSIIAIQTWITMYTLNTFESAVLSYTGVLS